MSKPERVAVVGAGISGIAAALALHRSGRAVQLLEREDRIGGRVGFAELAGREIMLGGKNIGRRYHEFRAMLELLGGTGYEPFGINTSRMVDGRLVPLDSAKKSETLRNIVRMCDYRDLLRLDRIARKVDSDSTARFLGSPLTRKLGARYDNQPLPEHFGRKTVANFLRPITVRMNGAEPDETYLGNFPTNMGMLIDGFDQPTTSLRTLLSGIGEFADVRCGSEVQCIRQVNGHVALDIRTNGGPPVTTEFDAVAVCTPAHAAAPLLEPLSDPLAKLLRSVRYFPATVAVVRYSHDVFAADVRAIALDGRPCSNVGSYGKQTRDIVRYTFSGRPGRIADPTESDVLELVSDTEQTLRTHLGIARPTRTAAAVRHWPHAYCAYLPHYGDFLDSIAAESESLPNIALAGDYLLGTSLEACCRSGRAAARDLIGRNEGAIA